jgi:transglutaminase-like putative cysteine protease
VIGRSGAAELRWWLLRAHWALGIGLLAFFTDTSRWLLLLAGGAWAAGVAMDRKGTARAKLTRLGSAVVALFLALAAADLLFVSRDLLVSVSLLLLGVQSIKLLLPKRSADGWQLCAIALLEFLAAAVSTERLSFAFFSFLFLSGSAGAMWSLHDQEAEESGRPAGGYDAAPRTAAWVVLLAGASGFLTTAILFAAVPRLEFRRALGRIPRGDVVAGFSDTIALREVTGFKADRRVVARVEFPSLDRGVSPANLYLRGAVYSVYEGGRWRLDRTGVSSVPRAGFYHAVGALPPGPLSVADIMLEPADHPRLFTYGYPAMIEGIPGPLLADAERNLFLPQPGHPTMRYRLRFATQLPPRPGARFHPGPAYLAFPEGYEDVRALGLAVMGTDGTDAVRARRLLRFFRTGFRYTLADPAPSLRRFLFGEKAGYCEHFAAGLALLLRAGGIPSRVAAGYLGGEWNVYGQYLIVRQSDAHAWVEAWIDGRWVTLDATPSQGETSPFLRKTGVFWLHVDWLRQRWDKYVVNFSIRTQAAAVTGGWSALRKVRREFGTRWGRWARLPSTTAALPALLAGCASYLLFRRRRKAARSATGNAARFPLPYARLLRRLERSGYRSYPGLPMEEILGAAVRARPEISADAARFVALYHRDRFGPLAPDPEARAEAFRVAERLASVLAARKPQDAVGGFSGRVNLPQRRTRSRGRRSLS